MKVLIVEDVDFMAKIAQKILDKSNIKSDIALLPSDAQRMVAMNQYDAILMDFGLPEMTGLELTKSLRDSGYSQPIIGLTANPDEYQLEDMKTCGLNACLTKPLKESDMPLLSIDASLGWFDNAREDEDHV